MNITVSACRAKSSAVIQPSCNVAASGTANIVWVTVARSPKQAQGAAADDQPPRLGAVEDVDRRRLLERLGRLSGVELDHACRILISMTETATGRSVAPALLETVRVAGYATINAHWDHC